MVLIDSDVLIDYLRGSIFANKWLGTLENDAFAIPGVVAMELVMGCRNQNDLAQIQKFLKSFTVAWPSASEFERSYRLLMTHRLSSGLSIPDSLIAAMALSRGARLYTT